MARIFPDPPIGCEGPEQMDVYRAIGAVDSSSVAAWKALPGNTEWRPDWMLLQGGRLCYLLAVSPLEISGATDDATPEKVATFENARMKEFLASCLPEKGLPIYGAVVFPNISQDDLDALQQRLPRLDTALWGREMVEPLAIAQILEETPAPKPLPPDLITRLRKKLCPETTIPASLILNPRTARRAGMAPRLTSHLLDLDQEHLSKRDLLPSPEMAGPSNSEKIQIVTGPAGSGKSLVLLYRMVFQERLRPAARVLALTHNKPLGYEMQRRLEKINPATKAAWQTFYHFCGSFNGKERILITDAEKNAWLDQEKAQFPELMALPLIFVKEEINWIRDQGFEVAEDYLGIERQGRKRPLDQNRRAAFLQLLERYRQHLEEDEIIDWTGVAENTWKKIREGKVEIPLFDLIFIDEAQFFAPLWFRLVLRCLEPQSGQLFLATDPTQGFLKRPGNWRSLGLPGGSSVSRLRKVYRNSREILEFATGFYRRRLPELDEEVNLADVAGGDELPQGEPPVFIELKKFEDESTLVIYEILAALDEGAGPENFLVILNGLPVKEFVEKLNRLHESPVAMDAKEPEFTVGERVRVTTLNATTGLESPIVFLCGVDALLASESEPGLAEAEKDERVRDHTRQIYMATTRASRRLCITTYSPANRLILEGEPVLAQ